jgi:mRNA interferase RelE/StbE
MGDNGAPVAVVLDIKEYEELLEEREDLEAVREYHEAKAAGETAVPLDEAVARIERERKPYMIYDLRILPIAEKQLSKFNSPDYDSIKAKIYALSDDPRPPGCRKLVDTEWWHIRFGSHRIVYEIERPPRS